MLDGHEFVRGYLVATAHYPGGTVDKITAPRYLNLISRSSIVILCLSHPPLSNLLNDTVLVEGIARTDDGTQFLKDLKVRESMVVVTVVGASSGCRRSRRGCCCGNGSLVATVGWRIGEVMLWGCGGVGGLWTPTRRQQGGQCLGHFRRNHFFCQKRRYCALVLWL